MPTLGSWIEQTHDRTGFRIDTGKVAAFVEIAVGTCQSEIVDIIAAAVLSRHDVLDMEGN